MSGHTRREFLARTAAGSALALSPMAFSADEAAKALQMAVARWTGAAVPEPEVNAMAAKLTDQVMAALGGMQRFVKKGDVVWVKPNMAWDRTPEQAANTNPGVVSSLVKQCLAAGAKAVKVGDYTCQPKEKCYPASGIEAAAKAAGAEVVYLDDARFRDVPVKGEHFPGNKWAVFGEMMDADLLINCPIVKHHSIGGVTLCMKNYMGVIGGKRSQWHQKLAECLCDFTANAPFKQKPLCVLDAVRILTANGPTGGDLKDVKRIDLVAAGTDIVALDALGAELLGHKPEEVASVKLGHERKLGTMDYKSLAKEISVA